MTEDAGRKPPIQGLLNTPGSVKKLRSYWKDRLRVSTAEHLQREMLGESDRATVILMAAHLDDALTFRLTESMAFRIDKKHHDHIYRFEGPLGSFSSWIEIAYLFGVIDGRLRSQLNDLREARNACAHCGHEIKFSTPALREVIKRIFKPAGFTRVPDDDGSIGDHLLIEFIIMFLTLAHSREYAVTQVAKRLSEIAAGSAPLPDSNPEA